MNQFTTLPKVELHLHLDCSLSYEVVKQINPLITFDTFHETFVAPPKCANLADYISRALKGFELMQTKENLRLVTLDLFEQLKADNVIYAEIRFAPLLHIYNGLTPFEVVDTVNKAVIEGIKQTGVYASLILCTLRHFTENQSIETIQLLKKFQGTKVIGFDLAADEAGFPITNHIKAYQLAKVSGINCTAHAGEAKGAESVWETLKNLHPSRIGHGVRSTEDQELMLFLKKNNIHLEICPTSNIQTNVFDKIENHSIDELYNFGISLSINTDARTISNVTLSEEYETLEKTFGWNKTHFLKCNMEAIKHSFTVNSVKELLQNKLLEGYS